MKKSIYLLFALFILSMVSCNYATNVKGNTMTEEDLMAKENKSLVQEKQYTSKAGAYWMVALTSKLKDARTLDEIIDNVPLKEDIVNTITFDRRFAGFKSSNGMYYSIYLELQKTVKYDAKKIMFVLKPKILTAIAIKASETQPIQIKFSNHDIVNIHNVNITYQKNNDPIFQHDEIKDTIMKAELSLDIINRLRTAPSDITIVFNTSNDSLTLPLPPIFIEYLREF